MIARENRSLACPREVALRQVNEMVFYGKPRGYGGTVMWSYGGGVAVDLRRSGPGCGSFPTRHELTQALDADTTDFGLVAPIFDVDRFGADMTLAS